LKGTPVLAKSLILILEDEPYVALDLASAVEDLDGRVAGPARDIDEALQLLGSEPVVAAIIDWHLPSGCASPVARHLSERQIPFVIHSTADLAPLDREQHRDVPLLKKPLQPRTVIACLLVEMRKAARRPDPDVHSVTDIRE
jgi:DNA-binding response OmpR family regulator